MLRLLKITSFSTLLVFSLSCSRNINNGSATIRVQLGEVSSTESKAQLHNKISAHAAGAPNWNFSLNPSTLSEINCYAVFVSGPEPIMQKNNCENAITGEVKFTFGPTLMFIAENTTAILDVPSGANRTIFLAGLKAQNGACNVLNSVDTEPDFSNLSVPLIVESQTLDLSPGEVAVTLTPSLAGSFQFDKCNFFKENSLEPLTISEADPYDFGNVAASGGFASHTFTLTNNTSGTLTGITGLSLTSPFDYGSGTAFPGSGGNCTTTLTAGNSCNFVVEFAPGSQTNFSETIEVNYNENGAPLIARRNIKGAGAPPATLTISGTNPIDFGTKALGSFTNITLTITNTGGVEATAIVPGGLVSPFSIIGGTCTTTLNPGANCTLDVQYNPDAITSHSDTLEISFHDGISGSGLSTRNIQGNGANPAFLTITESDPYDYGTVTNGNTATQTFTVSNTGDVAATGITYAGLAAPFNYNGGTCAATLNSGANCTIVVNFSPTTPGAANDAIQIDYHDGAGAQSTTRGVTGTGVAQAALAIGGGDPFGFGTLAAGTTSTQIFTVTNTGGVNATSITGSGLATPFSFLGGSYPGSGGDCGSTIAPAGSCNIVVQFAPVSVNTFSDTLSLDYNNGVSAQSETKVLQGVGGNPATLSISGGNPFNFGTKAVGSATNQVFTVQNNGDVSATGITASGLAAPYSFTGGGYPGSLGNCLSSLPAGSSCTIDIQFSPSGAGSTSDTLQLDYNDGQGAQAVTKNLQGTGAAPAALAISESDPYDFGSVNTSTTSSHTFTITNVGGVEATGMSGSGLAAPYSFTGGSYPGGGTCSTTLANGSSCTIGVDFSPTVGGTANDTFQIDYNNGAGAQSTTKNVTGNGS